MVITDVLVDPACVQRFEYLLAAVHFAHAHAAVVVGMHLDAGLDMQHVGAQAGDGRAAAAGVHEFQRIQQKAGLHLGHQLRHFLINALGGHALPDAVCHLERD